MDIAIISIITISVAERLIYVRLVQRKKLVKFAFETKFQSIREYKNSCNLLNSIKFVVKTLT
jgi:hypothetical protein